MKTILMVAILLAVCLSGCSLRPRTEQKSAPIIEKTPPKLLLKECCGHNEERCKQAFNNRYKFCPDDYEKKCNELGGYFRIIGNLSTGLPFYSCYESASDVGKACASDNECFYTCDLNNGILKNLCNLNNSEKNKDNTIETYDCSTDKPGVCSPAPIDFNVNCGGYKFELNGKSLKTTTNNNEC